MVKGLYARAQAHAILVSALCLHLKLGVRVFLSLLLSPTSPRHAPHTFSFCTSQKIEGQHASPFRGGVLKARSGADSWTSQGLAPHVR